MTRTTLSLLACLAGAVATGCGASGGASGGAAPSSAPASTGSYESQVLQIGRQFAQCARSHGLPDFPDPTIGGGGLEFGDTPKTAVNTATESCGEILRQLPPLPRPDPPRGEDLRHMRQFSACMRQHGVPDWPDPSEDGTFPVRGTPMDVSPGQPTAESVVRARAACGKYEDTWRIYVS